MNDVTFLRGTGQGFCYDSPKALAKYFTNYMASLMDGYWIKILVNRVRGKNDQSEKTESEQDPTSVEPARCNVSLVKLGVVNK